MFPDLHFNLPEGFTGRAYLFDEEIVEKLEDLNSLRWLSDSIDPRYRTPEYILQLDNQQAWLESRLEDYRRKHFGESHMLDCVLIVEYLCAYLMYTKCGGII